MAYPVRSTLYVAFLCWTLINVSEDTLGSRYTGARRVVPRPRKSHPRFRNPNL